MTLFTSQNALYASLLPLEALLIVWAIRNGVREGERRLGQSRRRQGHGQGLGQGKG